jgi:hypothetical protein
MKIRAQVDRFSKGLFSIVERFRIATACSVAARVQFPAQTNLSRGALVENEMTLVKSLYSGDPDVVQTRGLASA